MTIKTRFDQGEAGNIRLDDLTIRMVADESEKAEWNRLIVEHHYLHDSTLVGQQICYVIECRGKAVTLLSFSSPAYHLSPRDRWIGWDRPQMARRRHFLVANSRFLILPGVNTRNLASKSLAMATSRLSDDWHVLFGHPVVAVETFTEKRFPGTSYKADNWTRLGATQGFSRDGGAFYIRNGAPKTIWVKELKKNAKQLLSMKELPPDLAEHERETPVKVLGAELNPPMLHSLYDALLDVPDPRRKAGLTQRMGGCLALIVIGFLCGCEGLSGCAEFGKNLRQSQLKSLRVRFDKKTRLFRAPCHTTLWHIMNRVDPAELALRISAWVGSKDGTLPSCIAIDGKTLRGSKDADGNAMHVVTAVNHEGDTPFFAQTATNCKGKEMEAVRNLIAEQPDLVGCLLTFDALHANGETLNDIREKQANYLVSVKNNQPQLLAEAMDAHKNASVEQIGVHEDPPEASHGRIVVRSIKTFQFKSVYPDFVSVNTAMLIHRNTFHKRSGIETDEEEMYVSSLPRKAMTPGKWLGVARAHWHVESLHYIKDRTLKEDRCTAQGDTAVNMSTLRSLTANLLRKAGEYAPKISDAFKANVQLAINVITRKKTTI